MKFKDIFLQKGNKVYVRYIRQGLRKIVTVTGLLTKS